MRVFIVWVKNLVKHFIFLPNKEFRGYLVEWPFLWNTRELDNLAWLFNFQSCASLVVFLQVTSRELIANCTDSSLKLDSSLISHTHPLQLNPNTYREMIEEITIKFGTELKPTQVSWKSQLYTLILLDPLVYSYQKGGEYTREHIEEYNKFYMTLVYIFRGRNSNSYAHL